MRFPGEGLLPDSAKVVPLVKQAESERFPVESPETIHSVPQDRHREGPGRHRSDSASRQRRSTASNKSGVSNLLVSQALA
jgi:hypothetical protein